MFVILIGLYIQDELRGIGSMCMPIGFTGWNMPRE